ncbi:MAG: hypothetical protein C5B50_26965 [Verrucomicrobia bacterium]|nr:MAG: hypothetical protein C5B50_26965 [Verrucomicrobiota bacterium]
MKRILICGLLALVSFAVLCPLTSAEFISYDDPLYVTQNGLVQQGLTHEGFKWAFSTGLGGIWHPLTWLSHMAVCNFFHLNPAAHHLVNLALHVTTAILLFLFLARATDALWRSALVAALFALHPLHLESVAWISERKDVLSGFWFMITLLAYERYVAARRDRGLRVQGSGFRNSSALAWYCGALVFFALGLMSKAMLVTMPFVLLLLDYWPLQRAVPEPEARADISRFTFHVSRFTPLLLEKLPFLALSLAASLLVLITQNRHQTVGSLDMFPLSLRISNALVGTVTYIRKLFVPTDLAVFYPYPKSWPIWLVILSALLVAAITTAVLLRRRPRTQTGPEAPAQGSVVSGQWSVVAHPQSVASRPYLLTGWFFYLITLSPVLGLIQVGSQCMADRYTYLPLIGLFIILAWGGWDLLSACFRSITAFGFRILDFGLRFSATLCTLLILAACGLAARHQASYWQTTESLFRHALAVTENNYVAQTMVGSYLAEHGKHRDACPFYEAALAIKPDYGQARDGYGNALLALGRPQEALVQYLAAVQCAPDRPEPEDDLGCAYMNLGRPGEAVLHFQNAVRLQPDFALAHCNLGIALDKLGQTEQALAELNRALAFGYRPEIVRANLGKVYAHRGQIPQAIEQYREAVRLAPDLVGALNNLAWLLATSNSTETRNGPEAVAMAERAVRLTNRQSPQELGTLAAAYAEAGRFPDALATLDETMAQARAAGMTQVLPELEQQRKLYEAGKAYRQ